ncbi:MAG: hypothetical protein ACRC2K_10570, partial [Clostridium sp.]
MWKKKIRKKKLQYTVIAIILTFAIAILTACISLTIEASKGTKNLYKNSIHSDFYIVASKGIGEKIKKVSEQDEKIKEVRTYDGLFNSPQIYDRKPLSIYHNGVDIKTYDLIMYVIELDENKEPDWIISNSGENALGFAPKEGEIWVQKILADAHNIKLGDYYNIGSEDGEALRVSAIVNDSIKPNSMKSGQSIYINKKDYEKFS